MAAAKANVYEMVTARIIAELERGSPYIVHPLLSMLRADSPNGKTLKSFIIKRKNSELRSLSIFSSR